MLTLTDLSIEHRLTGVSATVQAGRLVNIIGPNGAGKSTLLAAAAGLLPYRGSALLGEDEIAELSPQRLSHQRAYLAQQQESRAMMRVFQYIELHLPKEASVGKVEGVVMQLVQRLDLGDKLDRLLTQLSGGEWQRVRLAAAFLQVWPEINPEGRLLLLDEPMNSLDVAQQASLNRLLKTFCHLGGSAVVSVHHLNHALSHADDIWLLDAGKLVVEGPVAKIMVPERLSPVFGVEFELLQMGEKKWLSVKASN